MPVGWFAGDVVIASRIAERRRTFVSRRNASQTFRINAPAASSQAALYRCPAIVQQILMTTNL